MPLASAASASAEELPFKVQPKGSGKKQLSVVAGGVVRASDHVAPPQLGEQIAMQFEESGNRRIGEIDHPVM
jgi:hypothetical protein